MTVTRMINLAAVAVIAGVCAIGGSERYAGAQSLAAPSSRPSAVTKQIAATTVNGTFAFAPKTLRIKVGTKVRWVNRTPAPHTVTGTGSWKFNSGTFQQGSTVSHVFKTAGTYRYKCAIHPYMTATIVVTK